MDKTIITPTIVSSEDFFTFCKNKVADYANKHLDKTDDTTITPDDVYIVWYAKELKNHKSLISTNLPDGMYYELTFNGSTNELYFDAYKKFENITYKVL